MNGKMDEELSSLEGESEHLLAQVIKGWPDNRDLLSSLSCMYTIKVATSDELIWLATIAQLRIEEENAKPA